jgi:hypothetical protein
VFRNGVRIGRTTVSTGATGHSTPTGVFTILEKNVTHESSLYKGAEMPNMQRLTWTGIGATYPVGADPRAALMRMIPHRAHEGGTRWICHSPLGERAVEFGHFKVTAS